MEALQNVFRENEASFSIVPQTHSPFRIVALPPWKVAVRSPHPFLAVWCGAPARVMGPLGIPSRFDDRSRE